MGDMGEEEVVRPGNRRILIKSVKPAREISVRQREAFLTHLAATCNVTLSASRAKLAWSTVYRLRRRDATFAAAWQEAIETGYDRLELGRIQAALAVIDGTPGAGATDAATRADGARAGHGDGANDEAWPKQVAPAIVTMTAEQAMNLLNRHRASVRAGQARSIRPRGGQMPTSEETDLAIFERLKILRRQRGLDAAEL